MEQHRHQEWLHFRRLVDRATPQAKQLHLIADNYTTHKHPKVQRWLGRYKRFHMDFTPASAGWLNMIERFFRDLTRNRVRRRVFRGVPELVVAIEPESGSRIRADSGSRFVCRRSNSCTVYNSVCPLENRVRQQVAYLQAHQRLAAVGGRRVHFHVQTAERVEGTWLACHCGRRSWSPSARGTAGFRLKAASRNTTNSPNPSSGPPRPATSSPRCSADAPHSIPFNLFDAVN